MGGGPVGPDLRGGRSEWVSHGGHAPDLPEVELQLRELKIKGHRMGRSLASPPMFRNCSRTWTRRRALHGRTAPMKTCSCSLRPADRDVPGELRAAVGATGQPRDA